MWYVNVKKNLKEKTKRFNDFVINELPIGKKYFEESNLDAAYIGSDMVFDISQGDNPYMYGIDVPSDYIFSYAASFGYTTYEKLRKSIYYDEIVAALSKFKAIGYRDINTKKICEKAQVKVPMCENIDPVLLYGFEKEIDEWDSKIWKDEKYILIYAYDSTMNDKTTINKIKQISKNEKLKIVSCGYYHKWCDVCVPASPKEFLEMFKYATYVITDTFHGTVFSLILHKNFASIIRNNGFKVRYLLESVKLDERIVDNEISDILSRAPEYYKFDEWIEVERKKSLEFVENNLKSAAIAIRQ